MVWKPSQMTQLGNTSESASYSYKIYDLQKGGWAGFGKPGISHNHSQRKKIGYPENFYNIWENNFFAKTRHLKFCLTLHAVS